MAESSWAKTFVFGKKLFSVPQWHGSRKIWWVVTKVFPMSFFGSVLRHQQIFVKDAKVNFISIIFLLRFWREIWLCLHFRNLAQIVDFLKCQMSIGVLSQSPIFPPRLSYYNNLIFMTHFLPSLKVEPPKTLLAKKVLALRTGLRTAHISRLDLMIYAAVLFIHYAWFLFWSGFLDVLWGRSWWLDASDDLLRRLLWRPNGNEIQLQRPWVSSQRYAGVSRAVWRQYHPRACQWGKQIYLDSGRPQVDKFGNFLDILKFKKWMIFKIKIWNVVKCRFSKTQSNFSIIIRFTLINISINVMKIF